MRLKRKVNNILHNRSELSASPQQNGNLSVLIENALNIDHLDKHLITSPKYIQYEKSVTPTTNRSISLNIRNARENSGLKVIHSFNKQEKSSERNNSANIVLPECTTRGWRQQSKERHIDFNRCLLQDEKSTVKEEVCRGGGGGGYKSVKKVKFEFRKLRELLKQSEKDVKEGLIQRRLPTPKLQLNYIDNPYDIEEALNIVNDSSRVSGRVRKQEKLKQYIINISKQQSKWDDLVVNQLERNRLKSNIHNESNSAQSNHLFQADFDKRIHAIYTKERLLRQDAQKRQYEDSSRTHLIQLFNEKQRFFLKEEELQRKLRFKSQQHSNEMSKQDENNKQKVIPDVKQPLQSIESLRMQEDVLTVLMKQQQQQLTPTSKRSNSLLRTPKKDSLINPLDQNILSRFFQKEQQNPLLALSPQEQIQKLYAYFGRVELSTPEQNESGFDNLEAFLQQGGVEEEKVQEIKHQLDVSEFNLYQIDPLNEGHSLCFSNPQYNHKKLIRLLPVPIQKDYLAPSFQNYRKGAPNLSKLQLNESSSHFIKKSRSSSKTSHQFNRNYLNNLSQLSSILP